MNPLSKLCACVSSKVICLELIKKNVRLPTTNDKPQKENSEIYKTKRLISDYKIGKRFLGVKLTVVSKRKLGGTDNKYSYEYIA